MYFTGSAGSDYDAAPYDAVPNAEIDCEVVRDKASQWGHAATVRDVLDLGCGFGRQLAQAAPVAAGRLVGVDASAVTCEGARRVLEPWIGRAEVHHASFENLDAETLGQFDLIYCVGTLYTVPFDAQTRLLATIRQCLRPGGIAVISYYAGTRGNIRVAVEGHIRGMIAAGTSVANALTQARSHLANLKVFQDAAPHLTPVAEIVASIAEYPDVVLTHEVLGHGITVQRTAELDAQLAPAGIQFFGYMGYAASAFAVDHTTRLFRAESLDVLEGGYRNAVFARAA